MLDQDTKRRIDNACDILVGKVPTPLAQVEQITLALIYKFMNDMDKRALAMGGQASYFIGDYEKYSWDNLMDNRIGAQERANLYEEGLAKLSTNGELPDLFRGIFKEANIPYRSARTLNLFLKEIDGFSYGDSENLGDAYEYLLGKTGSQGEAGQFRTPRHIIDFIVQVVDPSKYDNILDPACGTAGFLISALKHIYKANTKEIEGDLLSPVEQLGLSNSVYGYDITPDMVRISRVNMFLHNIRLPHIYEYDTLSLLDRWDDNFSCILANPPFMTPKGGVTPHNRFSIPSTRSEVLFVDYIMEHLTLDGKAGVIVPEGIIFQSGSAHKALRKKLITENFLWGVVSLPGGVFNPYSGVKTSILLLDRQIAKRSDKLIFLKVENDGYNLGAQRRPIEANDLPHAAAQALAYKQAVMKQAEYVAPEKGVVLVEKKKLAESGDYNLSGERYFPSASNSHMYHTVTLEEICIKKAQYGSGASKTAYDGETRYIRITDIDDDGNLKDCEIVSPSVIEEQYLLQEDDLLFARSGSVGRAYLHRQKGRYIFAGYLIRFVIDKNKALPKFIFYLTKSEYYTKWITSQSKTGTISNINAQQYSSLPIPLPPLSVQEEIVAELDSYQKIIDGAKQVVDNWKPNFDVGDIHEIVKLADIITLSSGKGLVKKDMVKGVYPVYGGNGINGYHKEYFIEEETVIVGRVGENCGVVHKTKPKCWITDNALYVTRVKMPVNLDYLRLALTKLDINQYAKVGGQPSISQQTVLSLSIPYPNLSEQDRIADMIGNEQNLVVATRKLIVLNEQKIKDRIGRLWEAKTVVPCL